MPKPPRLRRFLKRYQFVWCWPRIKIEIESAWVYHFQRFGPEDSYSLVYEWFLQIGPLDIRKWVPDSRLAEVLEKHRQCRKKAMPDPLGND